MLGIKSQPLDDGEVLLFMAFCSCQKLLFPMNYSCTKTWFFLFGVVEILSFMMITAPLSSFQYPSSIQYLILAPFDSVLGPKKILRISPANLGKNPSRGQESLLSTLDIQTGISWVFDIEIEWFKTPNSSTCTGLQLWWRIQSEINSFWITELQPKLGWKPFRGRILCFHARFQTWISWAFDIEIKQFKSSNSSTCPRLQLWWRIRSKIKSFWITESGGNLVGQKGSPGLI
jgi:hypothetical protein